MDIVKIIGVAILTTFAVLILKSQKPEMAAIVSIAGGIVVLLMFVNTLGGVISNIAQMVEKTGIKSDVFAALLKIIGIGYLTEFAAGVCSDAGNQSMAQKVLLAGKVVILCLALPIVNNLFEIVTGLLGG
jgi:stage III sporulation protein AD